MEKLNRAEYFELLDEAYNSLTTQDPQIIKTIILKTAKKVDQNQDLTMCALHLTDDFQRNVFMRSDQMECHLNDKVKKLYQVSLKISERYRRYAGGIGCYRIN